MKKILFILTAAAAIFLTSCGGGAKVQMDNPTNAAITVNIDGEKEYTLAPKELLEVKGLKAGEHTMSVDGGPAISFAIDGASLINPTLSTYVTDIQEYSMSAGDMDSADWVTVEVDGQEFWGPIEVFNRQPVIAMNGINFGVLTDFPEEIEVGGSGSTLMKKLFRAVDYPAYYESAYR